MPLPIPIDLHSTPELRILYEIISLPQSFTHLQDYFRGVMGILSEYFTIEYSCLLLHDPQKDWLQVEGLFGVRKEGHPQVCIDQKGILFKVLKSQQPEVIRNLNEEPLYEEFKKDAQRIEKIHPPLLCIPLKVKDEPLGVLNVNSLYGSRNEFIQDIHFFSILSSIISPVIKGLQIKMAEISQESVKGRKKPSFLDEILEEKLAEVLNKIDPYVESKSNMGLFDDMIAVVEKILIKLALQSVDHVQTAAALFLGINRNTLHKKIKELKIKSR